MPKQTDCDLEMSVSGLKMSQEMRALTNEERWAVMLLAQAIRPDGDRAQVLADLENSKVRETAPDRSLLEFVIAGYERPPGHRQAEFRGQENFPVMGIMRDSDGAEMTVHLYGDGNHRLYEFEIQKRSVAKVLELEWRSLQLM